MVACTREEYVNIFHLMDLGYALQKKSEMIPKIFKCKMHKSKTKIDCSSLAELTILD